jgi:hypothetical protein
MQLEIVLQGATSVQVDALEQWIDDFMGVLRWCLSAIRSITTRVFRSFSERWLSNCDEIVCCVVRYLRSCM